MPDGEIALHIQTYRELIVELSPQAQQLIRVPNISRVEEFCGMDMDTMAANIKAVQAVFTNATAAPVYTAESVRKWQIITTEHNVDTNTDRIKYLSDEQDSLELAWQDAKESLPEQPK